MKMQKETDYVMCVISSPSKDAESIARTIVERKLAACAQVTQTVKSIYWWEGKVVNDEEMLIILKTKTQMVRNIETLLAEIHPYEIPELIVLPVIDGLAAYLGWIEKALGSLY
jgi:periplasmic divalent cation tolerance protein